MARWSGWWLAALIAASIAACLQEPGTDRSAVRIEDTPCLLAVDCPLDWVCVPEGHCARPAEGP